MAAAIQTAGPAVHVSVQSGDGQYTIVGSETDLFVIRQQALGQQVVAFAFVVGTEIIINFQFAEPLTPDNFGIVPELIEALHTSHTAVSQPMPDVPDSMIRAMEGHLHSALLGVGGVMPA